MPLKLKTINIYILFEKKLYTATAVNPKFTPVTNVSVIKKIINPSVITNTPLKW